MGILLTFAPVSAERESAKKKSEKTFEKAWPIEIDFNIFAAPNGIWLKILLAGSSSDKDQKVVRVHKNYRRHLLFYDIEH